MFKTERLTITKFNISMASEFSKLSLDKDNMEFIPDEVFPTTKDAENIINYLMDAYDKGGPYVYPILLDKTLIGHVEIINLGEIYEVGYHIGSSYTGNGYATEALKGFLSFIKEYFKIDEVYGICLKNNFKSIHVLEKCGFKKVFDGIDLYQGEKKEVLKYIKEL